MSVIETERLTKSYGSARGIEEVTISVEEGEVFGFLGPNGAGKTAARCSSPPTRWTRWSGSATRVGIIRNGRLIETGIDPLAFAGVTAVAVALAAVGALLFDRRDISS